MVDPTPITDTPAPTTQDYLDTISKIKASRGVLPSVNWSNLPASVDTRQIVSAYTDGLPDAHANFVNAQAMGGHRTPSLDLSKVPGYQPPPPVESGGIYQDYPKTRMLSNYVLRPAAEMLGQGIGGAVGGGIGSMAGPVGAGVGGFTGATAGGTVGDEAMNKLDVALGLQHPESQPGGESTGARVGKEALTNAAMVGGGKIIGGLASELAAPFASEVNQPVQQAAKDLGVPLTASQQSNSKLLAQSEQMAAKLPVSAGILGDFYKTTRDAMMKHVNDLLGNKTITPPMAQAIGDSINTTLSNKVNDLAQNNITPQLDPVDVGNSVMDDISKFTNNAMQKSKATFDGLKTGVPQGATVPLSSTAQQASKLLTQQQGLPPSLQNGKLVSVLNDLLPKTDSGDLGQLLANASPDTQALAAKAGITPAPAIPSKTIPDLMNLRSALGDAAAQEEGAFATNRPGTKFMGSKTSGAYKSLINSIDTDLGSFSDQVGGNFQQQYKLARAQHGAMTATMENPYISKILSTDQPEKVVDMAIRPGDTSNLQTLQNMVSPDTYEQLGNTFKNNLIDKATSPDGQFIPQKLQSLIKQYGEPTLSLAIGPDGLNGMKQLANLSDGNFSSPGFRQFIQEMGRKDGENVSSFLLGAPNPTYINRIRALIGEDYFGEAQDGIIHNLLTNNKGNIDFGGINKRMENIAPENLATALPPDKIATLQKLGTVGSGIQASQREFMNPSGTAPMMGTFYIMRQLFSNPLNALKVLGGLGAATETYIKPGVTDYLTNGLVNPETASQVGSLVAKEPISVAGNLLSNPYRKKTQ